jgi:hypothetical protein
MASYLVCVCAGCVTLLFVGCRENPGFTTREVIPTIRPGTNTALLQKYVEEFSKAEPPRVDPEAPVPPFHGLVTASVDCVDHTVDSNTWVILCHGGSSYYDGQKLCLYSKGADSFAELPTSGDKGVSNPILLSNRPGKETTLLVTVWPTNASWWEYELWTNKVATGRMSRMTSGGWCQVAPDHTKVAFWRTDGSGFHSLHLWDANTGTIQDIISMWEVDPGSGTSWHLKWSADSNALGLKGAYGGFSRHRDRGRKDLNLIYLVPDKQMFQIPATAAPPNA